MKLAIITGSSKGLGASIAQRMVKERIGIIAVSRTENDEVKNIFRKSELFYTFYSCDLSDLEKVKNTFKDISNILKKEKPEVVYVINNAGSIEPIQTVGFLDSEAVINSVQINLTAPMLICNTLIQTGNQLNIPLQIVNVTSGAADRSQHGWSIYSSTKAGLNMFTKTMGFEQSMGGIHLILGFSPGIMDTKMQETIRASSKDAFDDVGKFIDYKKKGLLRPTSVVANALVDLLLKGEPLNGEFYHVNSLL